MLSEAMAQLQGLSNDDRLDSLEVPSGYSFPTQKLKRVLEDSTRDPLVLVACGSFSPITFLHLRMFVMAADYVNRNTNFEVVGSYLSPVADAYKKEGLASATHRLKMCSIAVQSSPLIMVDSFEAERPEYTRTALVLDHFDHELNEKLGGVKTKEGESKKVRIVLLAGADLVGTFSTPGVWSERDLDHILGRYGAMIIERHGTNIDEALKSLGPWQHNIWVISQVSASTAVVAHAHQDANVYQTIQNDVSSTKIRGFVNQGLSINYLIPAEVISYLEEHKLYRQHAQQGGQVTLHPV